MFSYRIVGWELTENMRAGLMVASSVEAIEARRDTEGTIFQSDRGNQYSSRAFRSALRDAGIQQGMSALGKLYDNAWTESVIGTIKKALVRNQLYTDLAEARLSFFRYINGYHNIARLHS